ncbi:MAG TPA: NADP-dependent oxidoreductase [Bryobacteraceae bacterium]
MIEEDIPQPEPDAGELLIRVYAAGVTPTELLWYPTSHTKTGKGRSHAVPAHEFSGIVAAIGRDVNNFSPGEEIYGMNDWFSEGALAEFCITQSSSVAPKPQGLTHAEAASVPIGALTAWQGLFDRAKLQPGERLLVHGSAGAVGVYVVQLARNCGAHIIATASARNLKFVSALGANQVIDYKAEKFEEVVQNIDVIFDAVGGDTLARSWKVLRPGGRLVTIAATSEQALDDRVKHSFFIVEPNRKQLEKIGEMLQMGKLRAFVDAVVPFSQASTAYTGEVKQRLGYGKMAVSIVAEKSAIA